MCFVKLRGQLLRYGINDVCFIFVFYQIALKHSTKENKITFLGNVVD
ncbi:hypothetical protein SOVF_046460 [Spinacia oleracea]|nr:hypothetical protein SOVF_046460 [Spinacia oleracea]